MRTVLERAGSHAWAKITKCRRRMRTRQRWRTTQNHRWGGRMNYRMKCTPDLQLGFLRGHNDYDEIWRSPVPTRGVSAIRPGPDLFLKEKICFPLLDALAHLKKNCSWPPQNKCAPRGPTQGRCVSMSSLKHMSRQGNCFNTVPTLKSDPWCVGESIL